MYKADRLNAILAYLEEHQALSVAEAMQICSASSATIRRDFSQLITSGMVIRGPNEVRRLVHHGMGVDQLMAVRKVAMRKEKEAIARHAASLVADGDVAFIDGGTTTNCMVKHFSSRKLRVITTCIHIANGLSELRRDTSDLEIAMPGGVLMTRSNVLYGAHTCSYLEAYYASWAFIGVDGIDGTSLYSVNEFIASSQQTMINNSKHIVLLMDHSKFGRVSMVKTMELDNRFTIIADDHEATRIMAETAKKNGAQIILVSA